jgi:8-oxo-dGTP pyrophosphatase MutT (NUDIX family)
MSPARKRATPGARATLPTVRQVSAGGVATRRRRGGVEVVLIAVGTPPRWQLPKGLVEADETPEDAAVRETREETGIEAEVVAPIETIEYWYVGTRDGARARFHKFVHFFLMEAQGGDVAHHDHEVHDAEWVRAADASRRLAFANERRVVEAALAMLERPGGRS